MERRRKYDALAARFERREFLGQKVQIPLANKIARMAWAMMAKGERYRQPVALAA